MPAPTPPRLDDRVAQPNQTGEDEGPDEQQDRGHDDGDQSGDDGNAALAAEESQNVRQLGALELVVADSADDAGQDADEGVLNLAEGEGLDLVVGNCGHQGGDDAGVEQLGDHEVGDHAGQRSGAVVVIGQADCDADREQDMHVVDQGTAGLDQEKADHLKETGDFAALHGGRAQRIANAHQNTADRQCSYGKHQCFAELLQLFHHKKHSS